MEGRVNLIRDLSILLAATMTIFIVDLLSPPTLAVSVAYAGLVLFAARPARPRVAVAVGTISTVLTCAALAWKGQLSFAMSDAFVSGLLSITLVWMIVLVGTTRVLPQRSSVRFREDPRNDAAVAESHADIVKLTEVQRTLLDRLNLATRTAGLAIWDRDMLAESVYLDDSFTKVFGLRNARGFCDVRRVIHPEDLDRIEKSRDRAVSDPAMPAVITDRFRIVRETDGELRHIQIHRRIFRSEMGKAERIIGVAWDVTDEVKAAEALMTATEAAQAASRAKSALLANVSHEIRTPMNGIIGMTGLLLDGSLNPTQRDYAETIRGSADSLLRVIDDILDFSKIEAGRMDVESLPTDIHRTVEEVGALMAHQAAQKHLELKIEFDPAVPVRAMTDPQRLRQCLVNLVGNALKFTESGSIVVAVKSMPPIEGAMMTRFEVRDTGIGIEQEVMRRLFEPFVQADSSTTRSFGGTGLGLSIVKRFVEMMDGAVGVASVAGEGSTFWFDLPLVGVAGEAAVTKTEFKFAGSGDATTLRYRGRVLVVEDNKVNQKVAVRILERLGCAVDVAENGAVAIERCEAVSFDLVLMDMQMPVMDGLTATTLIRQRELGKRRTPIVALTANAMNGEYERCMAVGMDGFLTKPLNVDRLCGFLSGFGLRDLSASDSQVLQVLEQPAGERESNVANPIDLTKLAEITGGDAEFTTELLDTFFASAGESIQEMTALNGADHVQLARIAHRLKGAAFNVHAEQIGAAAARIERDAATLTAAACASAIEEIRVLLDRLREYLQNDRTGSTRAA